MGTTEINNKVENEEEKINEDDIIENDCYEEIDIRKINQIIEKEKNWNNNTILYNNIINISNELENINEQNPKSEDENNGEENKEEKKEAEKENQNPDFDPLKNNKGSQKKILHTTPKIRPRNTSDEALNPGSAKKMSQIKEKKKKREKSMENRIMENREKNMNMKKEEQSNENNIHKIIPKNKLKNKKENEVIYSGTLEKILNEPQANKIVYTSRFCILTKKYFAYYKSKESYISLNKPMLKIEKEDIIRIENTFLEGEGYFGIVCEVNDKTRNLIDKVNSFVTNDENGSQLLLGFRSNKYEDMANWILMLNYFISENNMAE